MKRLLPLLALLLLSDIFYARQTDAITGEFVNITDGSSIDP